jgi:magnesium transporter
MKIVKNKSVQWVNVEKPTSKDLASLKKDFKLHPIIVDELREPSARARVEHYDNYLYFIYYFPIYDKEDGASVRTEIDFIVTKNAVATIHYMPLSGVLDDFDIGSCKSSFELLRQLINHLLNFEERQLRHIREKVELVGHEIFHNKEKDVLEKITFLKRDASEYRIIVRLQRPILDSLAVIGKKFWGAESEIYLNDMIGDHLKIVNQLEDYREAIRDFEDTNNQLMNLKINSAMKTFTSLSFITFPFMLFLTLFTIRTTDTPLIDGPHGFWIIAGITLAGMLALGVYFSNKKWF